MSKPVAVVCGLRAEAEIAKGPDALVIAGGGDSARLIAEIERIAPDVSGILSFGVCGGLAPGLKPGGIRVANGVVTSSSARLAVDAAWSHELARRLQAPLAAIAGVDAPLTNPAAKAALYGNTGAHTVDMESHLAARLAAEHHLPFAAVRVVTDPAERALPHAATVGMRADGNIDLAAILRSLAGNPLQLPGLIRTGLEARAAFAALLRCRQRLGSGFALIDLV